LAGILGNAGLPEFADVALQVAVAICHRYITASAFPMRYICPYQGAEADDTTDTDSGATVIDMAESAALAVSTA